MHSEGPTFVLTAGLSIKHLQGTQHPRLLTSDTRFEEWGWGTHFSDSWHRSDEHSAVLVTILTLLASSSVIQMKTSHLLVFVTLWQELSAANKPGVWCLKGDGGYLKPQGIRMEPDKRDMELLSNSMATYAHVKGKNLHMCGSSWNWSQHLQIQATQTNHCRWINSTTSQWKNSHCWFLGWTVPLRQTGKFW